MAKTSKGNKPQFASLNPRDMQGGLPSDFRGVIIGAAYCEWDYNGNVDTPVLGVKLTIRSEEHDEPIEQVWSAADLDNWAPGDEEGERAAEGPYAIRVGKKAEMSRNSNFAHLMQSILDCGEAAKGKPFTDKNLKSEITCLIGLDAQWDRVPQKKRSGMTDVEGNEGEQKKTRDILVVTEVFGYDPDAADEPAAKPKKKATKPADDDDEEEAPAPKKGKKPAVEEDEEEATEEDEEEDGDAELTKKVVVAVKAEVKKAGGSLKKGKLPTLLLKAFGTEKPAVKSAAVKLGTDEEFLSDEARPWEFDEEEGTLTI